MKKAIRQHLPTLLIILDRDLGLGELSSRNFTTEENVEFSVTSAFVLGKTEPCYDETEEGGASPYVAALATH